MKNSCQGCKHSNRFFPNSIIDICEETSLFSKNSCGFINKDFMEGIFLSSCDKVNLPIVFMQKYNDCCKKKQNICAMCGSEKQKYCDSCSEGCSDSNFYNSYYRLESNLFYNELSHFCKFIRKHKKGENCNFRQCLLNDAYAAAYFLDKEMLPPGKFDTARHKGSDYLEYLCETTYYTELAFPVKLEGKTIGVLIFGQILKEKDKENHEKIVKDFAEEHQNDDEFKEYLTRKSIKRYNELEFKNKVDECKKAVQALEKKISDIWEMYKTWYTDELSKELMKPFSEMQIPKESEKESGMLSLDEVINKYDAFKTKLSDLSESIEAKTGADKVICFAPEFLHDTISNQKFIISTRKDKYSNLKLSIPDLNSHFPGELEKVTSKDDIKKIIPDYDNPKQFFGDNKLMLFTSSVKNRCTFPIAVLVSYNSKGMSENVENIFLKEIDSLLNKLRDSVYLVASSIINNFRETEQRYSVQIMRHELGQSNAGYLTLLDNFEKDFNDSLENIEKYSPHIISRIAAARAKDDLKKCMKNSRSFAHIVTLRVNGTRYSGGISEPIKKFFYPYGEFLFKWNYIFSKTQEEKNLIFRMPVADVYDNPSVYPLMYADPDMIEQVAFNLTNNAMKYSHFGSAVTLNCYAKQNEYIIEVINYASPLSEYDKAHIFDYGYSGKNHGEGGSGLGLYISKKIAELHGGDLIVEQEDISDFNVPLLQLYDETFPPALFSKEIYDKVQTEIKRLKGQTDENGISEWNKLIGSPIPQNPFTPLYINENINVKTSQIKFTFSIPLK